MEIISILLEHLRLNQIGRVRANGVGDHIAPPQLVVCRDQSAGKSSVLEGESGIPFPRQDGLCTKFATEIILRHDNERRATATVIPHTSRVEEEKARLTTFSRQLCDLADLPNVIEEAATPMGVRGYSSDKDSPAFSGDVLRLEIVGKTGLFIILLEWKSYYPVPIHKTPDDFLERSAKVADDQTNQDKEEACIEG